MDASALASFPNPPADHVIAYGEDPLQFGELRLPPGQGPHPVIIDVREADEYHFRRIPGSINLPLSSFAVTAPQTLRHFKGRALAPA